MGGSHLAHLPVSGIAAPRILALGKNMNSSTSNFISPDEQGVRLLDKDVFGQETLASTPTRATNRRRASR